MNTKTKATFAVMATQIIFGFSFLFSKAALSVTTPLILVSYRFITAFLALNVLRLLGIIHVDLKNKPIGKLILMGFMQPVCYFLCETYGIDLTSAALAGVIIGLSPVVALVTGRILLGEVATTPRVICAFLSIIGVALTAVGGTVSFSIIGIVLLFGATLSSSLFSCLSRGISDYFSPFERTYVMFGLGAVVFTCMALVQNMGDLSVMIAPAKSAQMWISIAYLAMLSSICAFSLFNYALSHLPVSKTSIYSNFCTVVSVLGGIFIMHDSFSFVQILGIVIIIASVFGVSYQRD